MRFVALACAPVLALPLALIIVLNGLLAPTGAALVLNRPCVTVPVDASLQLEVPEDPDTGGEGGVGFVLPQPGEPRKDSLANPPTPIPADIEALYRAAAARYVLPWTLLAGIGMAETNHGRNNHTSSAGAQGLMQFMPATFAGYGVDGNGDNRADIRNDADSVHSAANYLTAMGVTNGEAGVRKALFAYNRATWYVNDVLSYAHAYGGGIVAGSPDDCGPAGGAGDPTLPPLTNERVQQMFAWARQQIGKPYVFGANGPNAWDCSSFTQATLGSIGISIPRTSQAQRDWMAKGNGFRVPPGQERPGDFVFTNTWRGPNHVGHVLFVYNPAGHTSLEAVRKGVGHYDYTIWANRNIYEIWRLGNLADTPQGT